MTGDPSTWTREEWAALAAELADLEREENIPDPGIAITEHFRRRDIREAAHQTWAATQPPCGCTHTHDGPCPHRSCGCREPHPERRTPSRAATISDLPLPATVERLTTP